VIRQWMQKTIPPTDNNISFSSSSKVIGQALLPVKKRCAQQKVLSANNVPYRKIFSPE
jgi:hypothetical protein